MVTIDYSRLVLLQPIGSSRKIGDRIRVNLLPMAAASAMLVWHSVAREILFVAYGRVHDGRPVLAPDIEVVNGKVNLKAGDR